MKKTVGTVVSACVVIALAILSIVFNTQSVSEEQLSTLKILLAVCACSAVYCFIVGELTRNYSQMDKLWSLLPVAYTWIIAIRGGMSARLIVYALIVTAWGARLTVNFARKGAYRLKFWTGNEDYRWSIVRQSPFFKHGFVWTLFDLFFISIYQNALVLAICLPALACMGSSAPFGAMDVAAAALAIAFLILETVSDEYQWRFHSAKAATCRSGVIRATPTTSASRVYGCRSISSRSERGLQIMRSTGRRSDRCFSSCCLWAAPRWARASPPPNTRGMRSIPEKCINICRSGNGERMRGKAMKIFFIALAAVIALVPEHTAGKTVNES